ncbi:MAG: cation:proton antiporter [Bacteroidetes bacterium]|nr:cation:proton antiporter [Bacteroidota bacterium]
MTGTVLVHIVVVIALAIGAQWLAWRVRVPSILLLLIVGFVAGPVMRILPPEQLQGEWVFAFVSLAIGIILFEGGLNLRLSELRGVGKAVFNLVTIGVAVTGILAAIAAHYVLEMPWEIAVVLGSILTVTGPTVVLPLIRYVRPSGRVNAIAKWEGITIDPVGAIVAVLVLEAVIAMHEYGVNGGTGGGMLTTILPSLDALLKTAAVSIGASLLGGFLILFLLRRHLVPDYLQNSFALTVVILVYAVSNHLHEESGLFAVTIMGVFLANQPYANLRNINKFKEDLQSLLIGCLFILLSARLSFDALTYYDTRAFIFLGILIIVIRPIAVAISSLRTGLNWKEQGFIAWLAPRGIVAAAVASLFSVRIEAVYGSDVAGPLVPIVYMVIIGTVTVYGLTLQPVARVLGMADSNPQGILFLGAKTWVQRIAKAIQDQGIPVQLIDTNEANIEQAQGRDLPAVSANALEEQALDELDLSGINRFMALTSNDDTNSLAAMRFKEVFGSGEVFQTEASPTRPEMSLVRIPEHMRGRPLFGGIHTVYDLEHRFEAGGDIRTFGITEPGSYEALQAKYGNDLILMFIIRGSNLLIHAEENNLNPQLRDTVIVMLPPLGLDENIKDTTIFRDLIDRALIINYIIEITPDHIVESAARLLSQRLPESAERLAQGLTDCMDDEDSVLAPGVVLHHVRLSKISQSELILIRCEVPLFLPHTTDPIEAFAFFVTPEDDPAQHLRVQAHLAGLLGRRTLLPVWREATDENSLRATLRSADFEPKLSMIR